MKKKGGRGISIRIDEWTNSVIEVSSRQSLKTRFSFLAVKNLKEIKTNDWFFDWKKEIRLTDRNVYKMFADTKPKIIQGLISLIEKQGFIEVFYAENAKINRGILKQHKGIGPNLFAFACKLSKEKGYGGFVGFISKSQLKEHYIKTLSAHVIGGQRMAIDPVAAEKLIKNYFT